MSCIKRIITNLGSTPITFNYKSCKTSYNENNINIQPNKTKTIWMVENSFTSSVTNPNLKITDSKVESTLPPITYPLGRQHIIDKRDSNYLIDNHLLKNINKVTITSKYWDDNVWWGNQGNTPQCVGYAWAHWIDDGPVYHTGARPYVNPTVIYENAQRLDEWPGENYDGTSIRGGVKYLKNRGLVSNYYWGYNITTLVNTVLNLGPVVVGTNWYYNMFFPNNTGLIRLGGRLSGGHAYVINGVDTTKSLLRIKNSWGKSWGVSGHAYISFSDMSRLIRESGEICIATEIR